MAVPSSGQLRLYADIGVEIGVAQSNVSLGTMSDTAGFTAPDAMGDFYGYSSVVAPSVTTQTATSVTTTTANLRGTVNDTGGENVKRGFRYGVYSNITQNSNVTNSNSAGTGAYNQSVNLSASTNYYAWAYACNSAGCTCGGNTNFTTQTPFSPTYSSITFYACSNASNPYAGTSHPWQKPASSAYVQWYNPNNGYVGVSSCSGPTSNPSAFLHSGNVQVASNSPASRVLVSGRFGYPSAGGPGKAGNYVQDAIAAAHPGTFSIYNGSSNPPPGVTTFIIRSSQVGMCTNNTQYYGQGPFSVINCGVPSDIRLKTNISYL